MAALAAIRNRDCSVTTLTEAFLARIADRNPIIHALRDCDATLALRDAAALDARLNRGDDIGPFGGLPMVVKENCDTVGYTCSAGLEFRANHRPAQDSWVTARLRAKGAVILGTSISDPGAFGVRTAEVTHPVDFALTVGGSSGGSAAALAAGLCLDAIGTDTGGSIRIPSACCGTVGLKPTFDALPMTGIFPLVPSLDHVGPMARSVADTALIWSGLSGQPQAQAQAQPIARIGYDPAWVAEADAPVRNAFADLLVTLRKAGVRCQEVTLPTIEDVCTMHGQIFFAESAAWHLARFPQHRARYPHIAQDWFNFALTMPVEAYVAVCQARVTAQAQVDAVLAEVDLILTPTLSVYLPPKAPETLPIGGKATDYVLAMVRQTCLFNHTGHPSLAMPMPIAATPVPPASRLSGGTVPKQIPSLSASGLRAGPIACQDQQSKGHEVWIVLHPVQTWCSSYGVSLRSTESLAKRNHSTGSSWRSRVSLT